MYVSERLFRLLVAFCWLVVNCMVWVDGWDGLAGLGFWLGYLYE